MIDESRGLAESGAYKAVCNKASCLVPYSLTDRVKIKNLFGLRLLFNCFNAPEEPELFAVLSPVAVTQLFVHHIK